MVAMKPNQPCGESEFSHGEGLRPAHLMNKPPSEGGMYRGKAPEVDAQGRERPR